MAASDSALLTDLYQLAMMQAYLDHGETAPAVFEFFIRRLPARRNFLMVAGLDQALDSLENLHFSPDEIEWLAGTGRFNAGLIEHLKTFRFSGDVHAMPEGAIAFANEPILRVTAPMPQAQFVETRLTNILHLQTLIASKAARVMVAARGRTLVDFGLRRAHGAEAGLMAARASYLAGFAGTATVLADRLFGVPIFGTMAHSFVQAYDDESQAFADFARSRPENLTLLIDTYDTEAAARKVVALAPKLKADGITIRNVRLDSGDLVALSKSVRTILDRGGLQEIGIFVSGGLDEDLVAATIAAGAPINGFGVGTSLTTSSDAPSLDCVYKLEEYAGLPRRKRSAGKETWPGRKQVWRRYGPDGRMVGDVLSLEAEKQDGEPLLHLVMRDGKRVGPRPTLAESRARAANELARLPEPLRRLDAGASYPVVVSEAVERLAGDFDRRMKAIE